MTVARLSMIGGRRIALWMCLVGALLFALPATAQTASASRSLWTDVQPHTLASDAPPARVYRALLLDVTGLRLQLDAVQRGDAALLTLPRPDGTFEEFLVADSGTLPPALQRKYPAILSLAGRNGQGDSVRVDFSERGFQAMVFAADGIWVVRPVHLGDTPEYMSFRRAAVPRPTHDFKCDVHSSTSDRDHVAPWAHGRSALVQTGAIERSYVIAVAANGEYTQAVGGGTAAGGLAAVTQAINRVNQVYENELGVHLTLADQNDRIIFTDPGKDPYSNDSGALYQNGGVLDGIIGNANYDVGHVFTTGSGGVAGLGVTCRDSYKARGTTGLPNPTGDAFYIDYVAHELGHQFGANHTFSSTSGSCGGGNRNAATAYEPGSGSTIMAYAGICGANNLQNHSDPYFHAISLQEIGAWTGSNGGACAAGQASGDAPPVIDPGSLPDGYTLPMQTPFALSALAVDADGDSLTYGWEQMDLGPPTSVAQGDTGSGPLFRTLNPTTSATRYLPRLQTVLGGSPLFGEGWPETDRSLAFRLTVRDNHGTPGTPQFGRSTSADVALAVTTAAGPFLVTRPNTNLAWGRGESRLVTWDVANTDVSPVSCATVAIHLSTDAGSSFPLLLAAGVVNDGSTMITVPSSLADTQLARLMIACENNVFFDVSDVNFRIAAVGDPDPLGPLLSVSPGAVILATDYGTSTALALQVSNGGTASSTLNFSLTESQDACASSVDLPWLLATPASGAVPAGQSVAVTVAADAAGLLLGSYSASLCLASNDADTPLLEVPVSFTVLQPANDGIFADGFDPAAQPIQDPSFESTTADGASNPFWDGSDTQQPAGGTPLYSSSGFGIPTHTGVWTVWFGGWGGGAEVQTVSQSVSLPNTAQLYIRYWMRAEAPPDAGATLLLRVDGEVAWQVDAAALPAANAFSPVNVDISAWADGGTHLVELRYEYSDPNGAGEDGAIFIDDVTVDYTPLP